MDNTTLDLQFLYLVQLLLLVDTKVARRNLIQKLHIWLQSRVVFLKESQFFAEVLEELLNDAGKSIDTDLTITSALRVINLKEILQLAVDAKVILYIEKLLPVSLSNFFRFL